jgi:hypothetical protein
MSWTQQELERIKKVMEHLLIISTFEDVQVVGNTIKFAAPEIRNEGEEFYYVYGLDKGLAKHILTDYGYMLAPLNPYEKILKPNPKSLEKLKPFFEQLVKDEAEIVQFLLNFKSMVKYFQAYDIYIYYYDDRLGFIKHVEEYRNLELSCIAFSTLSDNCPVSVLFTHDGVIAQGVESPHLDTFGRLNILREEYILMIKQGRIAELVDIVLDKLNLSEIFKENKEKVNETETN